ncbi:hypothetical protein [Nakamurella leprariae]|uniref:Uncharacterized protein n=1 Tax=Nakamurella leprariae TaxID=2803911 RepID=A0A938Y5R2_9ACTN|nr:hypothetical protein [Nakamurella leprariae]MBM9466275.1 hypothetical protein [Nakamurella leprariae]
MYMLVAIAVTVLVIALAWRGLGAQTNARTEAGPRPPRPTRPQQPPRIIAPDDDPEFLGEIDRKLRGEDKSG